MKRMKKNKGLSFELKHFFSFLQENFIMTGKYTDIHFFKLISASARFHFTFVYIRFFHY